MTTSFNSAIVRIRAMDGRVVGNEGLEPVFETLESAEYVLDLAEDLPDILEEVE